MSGELTFRCCEMAKEVAKAGAAAAIRTTPAEGTRTSAKTQAREPPKAMVGGCLMGVYLMDVYLIGVHYMPHACISQACTSWACILWGSPYCAPQRCSLPVNMYEVYGNFDFENNNDALQASPT
jgi:hypothetical protein